MSRPQLEQLPFATFVHVHGDLGLGSWQKAHHLRLQLGWMWMVATQLVLATVAVVIMEVARARPARPDHTTRPDQARDGGGSFGDLRLRGPRRFETLRERM